MALRGHFNDIKNKIIDFYCFYFLELMFCWHPDISICWQSLKPSYRFHQQSSRPHLLHIHIKVGNILFTLFTKRFKWDFTIRFVYTHVNNHLKSFRAPSTVVCLSFQLYSKLRCDDQPMLEHVEQLLGELGGEMEAEEGEPALEDDYEPCSDEEEDDDAEALMEHWRTALSWYHCSLRFPVLFVFSLKCLLKCFLPHLLIED